MEFNLNHFVISLSEVLDFIEMDVLGVTSNHSKRVAFIGCKIGEVLGMDDNEIFDLITLSILHDNGASEYVLHEKVKENENKKSALEGLKEHCVIGERNIRKFPFFTDTKDVLTYHHETHSGTGFFGKKGDEIPLMSQLIFLGDTLENKYNLNVVNLEKRDRVKAFVRGNRNILFGANVVDAFMEICNCESFWMNLHDEFINRALERVLPKCNMELTWDEVRTVAEVYANIIDSKSEFTLRHSKGLTEKIEMMADYYGYDEIMKTKLIIAADLHDIGKLAISNDIIDKPGPLNEEEMTKVKKHTYYTRMSLQHIEGFEDINEWASNHHEKLDGTGYPYGFKADRLDFNSRLMACLDVYQALKEERPYRKELSHEKSVGILRAMAENGGVDHNIVNDINEVFS